MYGFAPNKDAARIFGNMTYFISQPTYEPRIQKVTLVNGKFQKLYLDVYYEGKYAYGDFNHDGLKDAAVVIMENFGGNADYYKLAFLINDGRKLVYRASYYLDTWAIVNSVRAKNGKVIVDMYVHQEGDCNAGPSKRVRNVYEYSGQNIFGLQKKKNKA